MRDLEGKVALISGASSGLGKALALEAARAGMRLALCGRSAEKLAETASALPPGNYVEAFDLCDLEALPGFVGRATASLGRLDLLVNCAGANTSRGPVAELDPAALEYMLRLNCLAPAVLLRACHAALAASGAGLVINVLSTCCRFANEGLAAYTASKTAFEGLTEVYRKEARASGIRAAAVYPGGIDTPFRQQARPEYLSAAAAAEAIFGLARLDAATCPDELVIRPPTERNFR